MERELFTPLGLRESPGATRLAPEWLGAFLSAYLRIHGRNAEAQARVRQWLEALDRRLEDVTSGHLPVAFELPAGAQIDQAVVPADEDPLSILATAELLRTWVEDFDHAGG